MNDQRSTAAHKDRRVENCARPSTETAPAAVAELVLELTNPRFAQRDGVRCASADARLTFRPAESSRGQIESTDNWLLQAPIRPFETEEIRWYLEQYPSWPGNFSAERVRRIECAILAWGQALCQSALPDQHIFAVKREWERLNPGTPRWFSIVLDATTTADQVAREEAREAANSLLGLPWELMHDSREFILQGLAPIRVRRCLPDRHSSTTCPSVVSEVTPPVRILLVAPRPKDAMCSYIDYRSSALPLVEAIERLGDLVELTILRPATFPVLQAELERADRRDTPYHVVHFNGHGIFEPRIGHGGLCFEHPRHSDRPTGCIHQMIYADQIGDLLRKHHIPLVFLDACQSAQAEGASESIATELLKAGAASVVAMSHSVLVETARRFVIAFYDALTGGASIAEAMLSGQRSLWIDRERGRVLGGGKLLLQDWFVPVLYQGQGDAALFRPAQVTSNVGDLTASLEHRLGDLPNPPATGFIGRSRELLYLERLLRLQRWALVRGQWGEGKTALAVELARWMVRSQQVECVAFVSVETHDQLPAVVDALGRQLLGADYSVACLRGPDNDLEPAIQPIERALAKRSTLIVVDNMESILLPPYLAETTPEVLQAEQRDVVDAVLELCRRLTMQGATRVVFTSREALPAPFDAEANRIELARLSGDDAIQLIKSVLEQVPNAGAAEQTEREAIERLVEAVHGHARTLAVLAPALRERGVDATREDLVELMAEMEHEFPGDREQSLYASIELSLRRLPEADRERVRVLGMFHGGVNLGVLTQV